VPQQQHSNFQRENPLQSREVAKAALCGERCLQQAGLQLQKRRRAIWSPIQL
jgi:hypothetical protein